MTELSGGFLACGTAMACTGGHPGPTSQTQARANGRTIYQANRVTSAHGQPELACSAQRAGRAGRVELARNEIPNKVTRFA